MKIRLWNIAGLLVLVTISFGNLKAQRLLHLTEMRTNGKVFEVYPDSVQKENHFIRSEYPNIDINSLIQIAIDTSKIKQEALKFTGIKADLPVSRMKFVAEFLSVRYDLIKKIQLKSTDMNVQRQALESFSNPTASLFDILDQLNASNPLKIKVNAILSESNQYQTADIYNRIFDLLQDEVKAIETEYKSSLEQNKVVLRIGTFINNTPVHLEGFDSYKEGDYNFVPPFITSIPENQTREFQKYQKLANDFNEDARQALTNMLGELADSLLNSMREGIVSDFDSTLTSLSNAVAKLSDISGEVKAEIDLSKRKVKTLTASIDILKINLKNVDQADYLKNLTESFNQVLTNYADLKQSIQKFVSGNAGETVSAFKTIFETGGKLIDEKIKTFKNLLNPGMLQQISITQKENDALLKLGDEVSKLPLNNIPDQTFLDLKRTVERKSGDRLIFKTVLEKSSPTSDKTETRTIDYTSIGLYHIGLHNSIQASIILADNLSGKFDSNKQFQFAPSYSVLFKNGSRKSSFYNDFIDFGLGINVATLDFNNDDNPEVGLGLVFSSFKDYLQIGLGRNFGVDQNYWFFGIRLPLLGFNPGGKLDVADQ